MTAAEPTLADVYALLQDVSDRLARIEAADQPAPEDDPRAVALAAIARAFPDRAVTCREIIERSAALPVERLAEPLRRGFRTTDAVVLGRRLGEVAASPVPGFTVHAACRERSGTVWTVAAADLV